MADVRGANIYMDCASGDCLSKRNKEIDHVNLWNQSAHEIFAEQGQYFGRCLVCETVRGYKYKAPMRFNGAPDFSTGRVFGSRMEQKDFAKKRGLREL